MGGRGFTEGEEPREGMEQRRGGCGLRWVWPEVGGASAQGKVQEHWEGLIPGGRGLFKRGVASCCPSPRLHNHASTIRQAVLASLDDPRVSPAPFPLTCPEPRCGGRGLGGKPRPRRPRPLTGPAPRRTRPTSGDRARPRGRCRASCPTSAAPRGVASGGRGHKSVASRRRGLPEWEGSHNNKSSPISPASSCATPLFTHTENKKGRGLLGAGPPGGGGATSPSPISPAPSCATPSLTHTHTEGGGGAR